MSAIYKSAVETSREEDYRDYEAADVETGWPYRDNPPNAADPGNPPYGSRRAGTDADSNDGYRIAGVEADGEQSPTIDGALAHTAERDDEDEIEERVTDNIATLADIDTNSIEVHASGHNVVLEGAVDDITQKRRIELAAMSVDGVHQVRNRIELLGADSHIPKDGD